MAGKGKQFAFKILGAVFISLALVLALAWLLLVPTSREPPYEFVQAWGSKGSEPGQFNDPTGLAIAGDEVFVADSRNGRIQVFALDGEFKRLFGEPGDQEGELGRPMNLAIHTGELYVPEYFNDRVQVFDLDGKPQRMFGSDGEAPGQFNAPGGVAIDNNGALYVADFYNQRVQKLDSNGVSLRQLGSTGETGHAAGEFYYPTDVALDPGGRIYAADGYGNRIQVFGTDGRFLFKWGGPFARGIYGPFNGWFSTVTSVALGPQGNLFAVDFYNHRVQKFAPDGTFLTSFGREGRGPGQFDHPMAVAVAGNGDVFVADLGNNRIQRWRMVGLHEPQGHDQPRADASEVSWSDKVRKDKPHAASLRPGMSFLASSRSARPVRDIDQPGAYVGNPAGLLQ